MSRVCVFLTPFCDVTWLWVFDPLYCYIMWLWVFDPLSVMSCVSNTVFVGFLPPFSVMSCDCGFLTPLSVMSHVCGFWPNFLWCHVVVVFWPPLCDVTYLWVFDPVFCDVTWLWIFDPVFCDVTWLWDTFCPHSSCRTDVSPPCQSTSPAAIIVHIFILTILVYLYLCLCLYSVLHFKSQSYWHINMMYIQFTIVNGSHGYSCKYVLNIIVQYIVYRQTCLTNT